MVNYEGFDFPDDLYYTEDQIWVKKEDGKVRLGFTSFIGIGGVAIAAAQIAARQPDEKRRQTRQGAFSQKAGEGLANG